MVKEKKTYTIGLYIKKVSRLLLYTLLGKKTLETLKENVIDVMENS